MNAATCNLIFCEVLNEYHRQDQVDAEWNNPYPANSVEALLFHKCWIDVVQWHLEDLIRDPQIDPPTGIALKRRIDRSNQQRTDLVENIDSWMVERFKEVKPSLNAQINSESPAWAIDRLSILALKIYHMEAETKRKDADPSHIERCIEKLAVLKEQQIDLSGSIDRLLEDIAIGAKKMKVYRQMKMYNDASLNPILYQQKR